MESIVILRDHALAMIYKKLSLSKSTMRNTIFDIMFM